MMKLWYLALGLLLVVGTVAAADDSPAARMAQAERYLRAVPPEESLKDIAEELARDAAPAQRDLLIASLFKNMDIEAVRKAMKEAMVKVYTAEELTALADFYSTPVGKSAMKKTGRYLQTSLPAMMPELKRAMDKARAEVKPDAAPATPAPAAAPTKK